MLKAFCPVVTMLLLFATRLEQATPQLIASVAVISTGVAIASYGEMHLSIVSLRGVRHGWPKEGSSGL